MRLVFVSHSFSPEGDPLLNLGGMQRVAVELHAALARVPGVMLGSLVLRSSWAWVHWRTPLFLVATWWKLRRLIRRGEVDTILFSSMVTASLAVALTSVRGREHVRLAAIAHGLDVTTPFRPYQRFVRRVFGRLDFVLPVSRATGEACLARGLHPDRLQPIRNGVDLARFPEPSFDPMARRALLDRFATPDRPVPNGGLVLVSVGRHVRRKGFEWFVRHTMPLLDPGVQYWIVGEGPETPHIAAAIEQAGLASRVRLMGRLDESDLQRLLLGADLFVMPNVRVAGDMEGFGVVILEAGLSGLPTVGARLEGVAEVVQDGINGTLVSSEDAGAFAAAITAFLGNPDRLTEASRRARVYTTERFGWDAVALEYVDTLRKLLRP